MKRAKGSLTGKYLLGKILSRAEGLERVADRPVRAY
jgi:hypothetical protein